MCLEFWQGRPPASGREGQWDPPPACPGGDYFISGPEAGPGLPESLGLGPAPGTGTGGEGRALPSLERAGSTAPAPSPGAAQSPHREGGGELTFPRPLPSPPAPAAHGAASVGMGRQGTYLGMCTVTPAGTRPRSATQLPTSGSGEHAGPTPSQCCGRARHVPGGHAGSLGLRPAGQVAATHLLALPTPEPPTLTRPHSCAQRLVWGPSSLTSEVPTCPSLRQGLDRKIKSHCHLHPGPHTQPPWLVTDPPASP